VAYLVTIKNILADGKTFKLSTGHRLFTNRKNIYFEGRVHEQIIFSVARAGGEERPSPVTLLHLGYGLSQEIQDKKNERNRQLLLKMIEENPADAYAHFTLGQNYNLSHEYEKALEHYLIALEKNRFQKSLKTQLLNTISEAYFKLKQYDRALEFAERSLALNSAQIGAYYLQYRIAEARGEWNNALQWLEKLREKNKQVAQGTLHTENDILLSDLDIAITQANLLYRANRVEEARNVLKELLRFPVELSTLKRIVRFLLDRGEEEMARTALLENEAHLDSELLDALGLIQIKQQNFLQAIQTYTRLFGLQPDNLQIVKRLAGLFLKIGEREKAEQLLKMLNELNVMQPKAPASV
jgi:tetratricopeptide (TPR) repeat protein